MKLSVNNVLRAVLPLMVLAACVLGAKALIASKPVPQKKPRDERAVLVQVEPVKRGSHQIRVQAQGAVIATREVQLMTEISGRVTWRNPELTTGGLVAKDEPLVRVDARDYKLALDQQQAAVERARAELEMEQGRRNVAEREWKLFGDDKAAAGGSGLALRDPQMRTAKLGLTSAQSSLSQARLSLGRTGVRAPFNALVRVNSTEVGRLVTPQQSLATLVDTDTFTVVVSVPVADLQWLRIPGTQVPPLTQEKVDAAYGADDPLAAFDALGSRAVITQPLGDNVIERRGLVARLVGELDPVGRMARILVGVHDPMGLAMEPDASGNRPLPLLLGAYVNVDLLGSTVEGLIEVPRVALREGDRVYVYSDKATLEVRTVKVLRRRPDTVLIREGLEDGERIITSAMPVAVAGMELRTQ